MLKSPAIKKSSLFFGKGGKHRIQFGHERIYIYLVVVVVRSSVYIPEYEIFLVLQIFDTDKQAFPDNGIDVHIDF